MFNSKYIIFEMNNIVINWMCNILIFIRPENGGKTCSGGDQKYKLCSTEQVKKKFIIF